MRRIFLIGYMGAGKTTMGKELSKQSGLSFIDLDHFMEGRYRKTVRQLFEEKGEETFRQIEKKALHEVADFENVVISTGGGTPCFFDNMAYMNSIGTTVYLKASPQGLSERLEGTFGRRLDEFRRRIIGAACAFLRAGTHYVRCRSIGHRASRHSTSIEASRNDRHTLFVKYISI